MIFTFLFISCDDSSTSPQSDLRRSIKVIDENGNRIPKVEVTFMYNNFLNFNTTNSELPKGKSKIQKLSDSNVEFKLYQNMPNPVRYSTFLRFSIHHEGNVRLQINNIKSYQNIFSFSDTLSPGLYQFYFDLMDSSFTTAFKNGFYNCSLVLEAAGSTFITNNVVLIISPKAEKDLITNTLGTFYVTKEDISWGKSYYQSDIVGVTSQKFFNGEAYFKLKKDGYFPSVAKVYFGQDEVMETVVVLFKEEE